MSLPGGLWGQRFCRERLLLQGAPQSAGLQDSWPSGPETRSMQFPLRAAVCCPQDFTFMLGPCCPEHLLQHAMAGRCMPSSSMPWWADVCLALALISHGYTSSATS